jgi:hypothetical protein
MNGPQLTQAGATTLEPRISISLSPSFPSDDTLFLLVVMPSLKFKHHSFISFFIKF